MREQLLSHLPWFVSEVAKLPGIRRIALLGSITTDKLNPKDLDFLVVVGDDLNLERWPGWAEDQGQNSTRSIEARISFLRMRKVGTWVENARGRDAAGDTRVV